MADYRTKKFQRQRERQLLGSHGAASKVRHIDPATYQPTVQVAQLKPPKKNKTAKLLDRADAMLLRDAKRRYGRKRARNMIVTGRYR